MFKIHCFPLFLLYVTVLVLLFTSIFGSAEEETDGEDDNSICSSSSDSHSLYEDYFCCGEEKVKLGHEPSKYFKECSVPPKDDSMSFSDCHWKFYECMASKSMDNPSNPLTLQSYGEMMAKNMSEEKRNSILALMKDDEAKLTEKLSSVKDEELRKVEFLKEAWKIYFDAEFQVCKGVSKEELQEIVSSNRYNDRSYWDPSFKCNNSTYPATTLMPYVEDYDCVGKLQEELKLDTNFTEIHIYGGVYTACRLIELGFLTKDELSQKIGYDRMESLFTPRFLSQAVQAELFKLTPFLITAYLHINVEAMTKMEDVAEKLGQNAERILKDFNIEPTPAYLNIFVLDQLFGGISNAYYNVC